MTEMVKSAKVVVAAIVAKYLCFVWQPSNIVFTHKICVFPLDHSSQFALLQSNIHEAWAREYSSTLETRLNYSSTDCFETFPFSEKSSQLNVIGEKYYLSRRQVMIARHEGLTKTYNRFHNPDEPSKDIAELRLLHLEMDQAVTAAYSWGDLDLGHGFHQTRQGLRYTISEAARHTVLDRLLALNHQRYAEEVAEGLHDKGAKKAAGKGGKGRPRKVAEGQNTLF